MIRDDIIYECYKDLAYAVVISAVDDLAKSICDADEKSATELVSWFYSDNAKIFLFGLDPTELIDILSDELKSCNHDFKLYKEKFPHYRIR